MDEKGRADDRVQHFHAKATVEIELGTRQGPQG